MQQNRQAPPDAPGLSAAEIIATLEGMADQMCHAIDGSFDFRVATDSPHPTLQKLAILVNFLIQNAESALERVQDSYERLTTQLEERQALEAALRQKIAEALEADRVKSMFFATMHHELRTPMNAILGMSAILDHMAQGAGEAEIGAFASHLHGGAIRLNDLIEQSLQISQIEAGRIEVEAAALPVATLVSRALRREATHAAERDIEIVALPEGMTRMVWADAVMMRRALTSLLSNAVKFSPPGGRVTISAGPAGPGRPGRVAIRIADQGPGMTEAEIERALKPFRQLDEGDTRRHEGAGLGLTITDTLVRLNDGVLRLYNGPAGGLVAEVDLPAPAGQADALAASGPGG